MWFWIIVIAVVIGAIIAYLNLSNRKLNLWKYLEKQYNMKRITVLYICSLIILFCAVSCRGNRASSKGEENFLSYNGNYHEDIIKPEVLAWKRVASLICHHVSPDTETQWSAMEADSIGDAILSNPRMPVGEQIAMLYEMQNFIAYGMSYLPAVIGLNKEIALKALNMGRISENMMDSLRKENFSDPQSLVAYQHATYMNFCLFTVAVTQYADGEPQLVASALEANENFKTRSQRLFDELNDVQAYRSASLISNTALYITSYVILLSLSQPIPREEILPIGIWIDEMTTPIIVAIQENKIPSLNIRVDDYSETIKEATTQRVHLIRLLADGIEATHVNFPLGDY